MQNGTIPARAARFFRLIYLKLFRINDTPQKIAIGLGIGVFSGVLPGTGPVAALFLAFIFRVNRASALLGSIITNTWLSIPAFLLSVKVGAWLTGLNHHEVQAHKLIGPILIGYFVVAACIGFVCYVVSFAAVTYFKKRRSGSSKENE